MLTDAATISEIPATLGRQFDIALGTATDLIRADAAGIDVLQIAGNTVSMKANPFVQVIVRPDSGITDIAQLKGKRVGSPTLSGVIHAAVLYWARCGPSDDQGCAGARTHAPGPAEGKAGRCRGGVGAVRQPA